MKTTHDVNIDTLKTVAKILDACVERMDYFGYKKITLDKMSMEYLCGATSGLYAAGQTTTADFLARNLTLIISVRGYGEVLKWRQNIKSVFIPSLENPPVATGSCGPECCHSH